jgi:hypothetical protein
MKFVSYSLNALTLLKQIFDQMLKQQWQNLLEY